VGNIPPLVKSYLGANCAPFVELMPFTETNDTYPGSPWEHREAIVAICDQRNEAASPNDLSSLEAAPAKKAKVTACR